MFLRISILLAISLLLYGFLPPQCANEKTMFDEAVCKIPPLTVHIADNHSTSSHPYLRLHERDKNKLGVSMPVNGYLWLLGYKTNNGVYADNYRVAWHEVEHVLHHHCPEQFADPHAKETVFGYFFGEANEVEIVKDALGGGGN